MIKPMVLIAAVIAAMSVAGASAEEKYGVTVYPGAEYDEDTTRYLDGEQYVEVAIQGPPRKDMASGQKVDDTLITITKID